MHPVFLRLFGLEIAWYGVLIATGVLVGVFLAARRAKTIAVAPEFIMDLAVYGVILGFVGSRVFLIFGDLRGFIENPLSYVFSRQGYVFFGGLITAAAFTIWYVRRHRQDPWQIADIMSPSLAIAHALGRVGCFMTGCCYGRICPKGWESIAVSFPVCIDQKTGSPSQFFNFAYWDQLSRGLIEESSTHTLPMLPVQLYEAAANLLIFLGLMWLWRRRTFRGQILATYLAAYGTARFLLEFLRGDYGEPVLFQLLQRGQMSQLICVVAIAVGLTIWFKRRATPLEPLSTATAKDKKARSSPAAHR